MVIPELKMDTEISVVGDRLYRVNVINGKLTDEKGAATDVVYYKPGDTVYIKTEVESWAEFVAWNFDAVTLDNAEATSTSFVMPSSDVTITAQINRKQYTLTIEIEGNGNVQYSAMLEDASLPPQLFTKTSKIQVKHGTTVTLTQSVTTTSGGTPRAVFAGWLFSNSSSNILDETQSQTFDMTENLTVKAVFNNNNKLTVTDGFICASNQYITTNQRESFYPSGNIAYVTAPPRADKDFSGWVGSITLGDTASAASSPNFSFPMPNQDVQLTAQYKDKEFDLNLLISGNGTVKIVCTKGTVIVKSYTVMADSLLKIPYGAYLKLTALDSPSYAFSNWLHGTTDSEEHEWELCNEDNEQKQIDSDIAIQCFFKQLYLVEITNGTVISPAGKNGYRFIERTTIQISATVNDGMEFEKWTCLAGGVDVHEEDKLNTSFIMPPAEVKLIAELETIVPLVTISVTGSGSVEVAYKNSNSGDAEVTVNSTRQIWVLWNSTVKITRVPATGYGPSGSISFLIRDKTYTIEINFIQPVLTLNILGSPRPGMTMSVGNGSASSISSGSHDIPYGSNVFLTATPDATTTGSWGTSAGTGGGDMRTIYNMTKEETVTYTVTPKP